MKRTVVFVVSITLILLLFSACNARTYPFCEPVDKIVNIELVSAESSLEYTVRKTLSEAERSDFLPQLQMIQFQGYIGDPNVVYGDAIKITYQSGNYEMICHFTNEYVKAGKIWTLRDRCKEEVFYKLFNSFLTQGMDTD